MKVTYFLWWIAIMVQLFIANMYLKDIAGFLKIKKQLVFESEKIDCQKINKKYPPGLCIWRFENE